MKKLNNFAWIVLILACQLFTSKFAVGQVNIQNIGSFTYAKYDGIWYTVINGQKGDLVDTNHIIVRVRDRGRIEGIDFSSLNLPTLRNVRGRFSDGYYELEVPHGNNPFQLVQRLEQSGKFEETMFNIFLKVDATPNDPQYPNQWNAGRVQMANTWDITKGSSNIIVAVIDVGGDYNHEDLAANRWSGIGYDFYDNDSDPYPSDGAGHGTAVAGIIGAVTNNSLGVSGIAGGWGGSGGIRLMHLDAGYRDQYGLEWISVSAASQATDSAAAWGARVINMSFGGITQQPTLESAINRAVNNYGVMVIASAGNYRSGQSVSVRYPAAYSNVIAVGATTESDYRKSPNDGTDEPWWGSCYGPELDVVAPGIHVWTTDITGSPGYSTGNYYDRFNGTSAAAPHVSGLVGLLRSINSQLAQQQIYNILTTNTDKVPGMGGQNFHNEYGYGRINAHKALLNVLDLLVAEGKSISATATAQNNGRRLVRDASYFNHLVFSSGGEIFYRRKFEYSGSWDITKKLNTVSGENNFPCITYHNNGSIFVTWQRKTSTNNYDIYFGMSLDNGVTWDTSWNTYVLASITASTDPLPVIQADYNGYQKIIVFNSTGGLTSYVTNTMYPYNINWTQQVITSNPNYIRASTADQTYIYASPVNTVISYQYNTGGIYYRYYTDGSGWSSETNLSSIVPGGGVHETPSITNVQGGQNIHAAWKRLTNNGATEYDHVILHRKSTNYYTWPNEYSLTYYAFQELPSITGIASNKVDFLFQVPSQFNKNIAKMRYNGSTWSGPTTVAENARYPAVSPSFSTAKYVWTSGLSSPYNVTLSSEILQKDSEGDPLNYYSRSIAWLDSSGSYLEVKLYPIFLKMKDCSRQRIDMIAASLDNFELTPSNSWGLLSSLPFQIPLNAEELVMEYSIAAKDIYNLFDSPVNNFRLVFSLANKSNQIISNIDQSYSISSAQLPEIRKQISFKLDGLRNLNDVRAFIRLNDLIPNDYVFASLGHIYDFIKLSTMKPKLVESSNIDILENALIQNYPNPFNPVTQLNYEIPRDEFVTLKVFDLLGREVETLVNEVQTAGYKSVSFDGSNLPSGLYFYRLQVGKFSDVKKMILMK